MVAVVAGHICIDLTPSLFATPCTDPGRLVEVGPLGMTPGGAVANTGLALGQLGVPVRCAADVGDDRLGHLLRTLLTGSAADVSGLRTVAGRTTSYSVVVQAPGEDRSFWHHVGANESFDGTGVDLSDADLLHVGYPPILPAVGADGGRALMALLGRARAKDVTTSVDLATLDPASPLAAEDWGGMLRRALPAVDVFGPSVDDLASVLGTPVAEDEGAVADLASSLIDQGAAVVLLKRGAAGLHLRTAGVERLRSAGAALVRQAEEWADRDLWAASPDVDVLGTTGAGDTAVAGLLCGILSGLGPEGSLRLAAASAALRISTREPLPPAGDVLVAVAVDVGERLTSPRSTSWAQGSAVLVGSPVPGTDRGGATW